MSPFCISVRFNGWETLIFFSLLFLCRATPPRGPGRRVGRGWKQPLLLDRGTSAAFHGKGKEMHVLRAEGPGLRASFPGKISRNSLSWAIAIITKIEKTEVALIFEEKVKKFELARTWKGNWAFHPLRCRYSFLIKSRFPGNVAVLFIIWINGWKRAGSGGRKSSFCQPPGPSVPQGPGPAAAAAALDCFHRQRTAQKKV